LIQTNDSFEQFENSHLIIHVAERPLHHAEVKKMKKNSKYSGITATGNGR
jgi:hypothetical protein